MGIDPIYLGDGAYARISQFGELVIYAHDGIRVTDSVVLGVYETKALEDFIAKNRGRISS